MNRFILAFALTFGAAGAASAQNASANSSTGSGNGVVVNQSGDNSSTIDQGLPLAPSTGNQATVNQTSDAAGPSFVDNTSDIDQTGDNNDAKVTQLGLPSQTGPNTSDVDQSGSRNDAVVAQGDVAGAPGAAGTSDNNRATVTQSGDDNEGFTLGSGLEDGGVIFQGVGGGTATNNDATVTQDGNSGRAQIGQGSLGSSSAEDSDATITQDGEDNSARIEQGFLGGSSDTDVATVTQDGLSSDNVAIVKQGSGAGLISSNSDATVTQNGSFSRAEITQSGDNHSGIVGQLGTDNRATVTQTGTTNEGRVYQGLIPTAAPDASVSNGSRATLIQDGDSNADANPESEGATIQQGVTGGTAAISLGSGNRTRASVTQSGDHGGVSVNQGTADGDVAGSIGTVNQLDGGFANEARVFQGEGGGSSTDDTALVTQSAANNVVHVRQGTDGRDSNDGTASVTQTGDSGDGRIRQSGSSNDGIITQDGNQTALIDQDDELAPTAANADNTATIGQSGTGLHNAKVFQDGTFGYGSNMVLPSFPGNGGTATEFSTDNTADVTQSGTGSHRSTVDQNGDDSDVTVIQAGAGDHFAFADQGYYFPGTTLGNIEQTQNGGGDLGASAEQSGASNQIFQTQSGTATPGVTNGDGTFSDYSYALQNGDDNLIRVIQSGGGLHDSHVLQANDGANGADDNEAFVTQSGTAGKALADIVQNGGADGNMGSINQSGTGLNQRSFITQTGALAQDNDATSIQSGAGSHFNDITQSAGSLNTAMVTQSGALDHTNTTAQTGSGNNNTVTQN